jgi:ketosteroid isomerase-like protein
MTVENIMGKKINTLIHGYIHSFEEKNIEKTLSYFTEDATWIVPQYKIKGKKEIEEYILWLFENIKELTFIYDGIGIMAQGNKAIYQNIFRATIGNDKVSIPTMFIFRLRDNKFSEQWIINNWFEYTKTNPFNTHIGEIGSIIHIGWNRDYSNL